MDVGLQRKVQFRLVPGRGGSGADRWLIANPVLPLSVRSAASNMLIIAGTPIRHTGRIFVFPGGYVAALAPNPFIDAEPVTVPAGPIAMGVPLHARVHEGIEREIGPQVRDYIDKCARINDADPDGCPFDRVPNYVYPPAVTRKIIEYPKLRVTTGSWSDVSVTSVTQGRAEARGPRPTSESLPGVPIETFTVTGSVKLVDGKVVFYPQK